MDKIDYVAQLLNGSLKLSEEVMQFLDAKSGDKLTFNSNNVGETCIYKAEYSEVTIGEDNTIVVPEKIIRRLTLKEEGGVSLYEDNGDIVIKQAMTRFFEEAHMLFADAPDLTEEEIEIMRQQIWEEHKN